MKGAQTNRALALVAAFSHAFTQRAMQLAELMQGAADTKPAKSRGKARSRNTTAQAKRVALKARNRAKHRSHLK